MSRLFIMATKTPRSRQLSASLPTLARVRKTSDLIQVGRFAGTVERVLVAACPAGRYLEASRSEEGHEPEQGQEDHHTVAAEASRRTGTGVREAHCARRSDGRIGGRDGLASYFGRSRGFRRRLSA